MTEPAKYAHAIVPYIAVKENAFCGATVTALGDEYCMDRRTRQLIVTCPECLKFFDQLNIEFIKHGRYDYWGQILAENFPSYSAKSNDKLRAKIIDAL